MNYDDLNPEENRLDQTLRDKFADFELPPAAPVWAGIEARLGDGPPPSRGRLVPLPLLFFLTALLSGLVGWWAAGSSAGSVARLPIVTAKPRAVPTMGRNVPTPDGNVPTPGRNVPTPGGKVPTSVGKVFTSAGKVFTSAGKVLTKSRAVLTTSGTVPTKPQAALQAPTTLVATGVSDELPLKLALPGAAVVADTLPAVLRPLLALETTYQTQPKPALTDPATADRAAVLATLRAERTELLHLQRRTDSLLLALGDVPAAAPLALQPDSAQAKAKTPAFGLPLRRWSVLLNAAPEQNYLGFDAPGHDELTNLRRNQETGRGGFNASLLAEYQATKRLSVGAGVGYSRYGSELRQAVRSTTYDVRYDTTLATTTTDYTNTIRTYSVRIVQITQLNPVFNSSGQVLRYDTVYVPRNDTLRTTLVSHDTIRKVTTTVTPLLQPTTTTTYKTFRPDYRFLTLPLMVRYRLTPSANTHWWADVAAGAQFQFFLGGTQLVSNDGQTFHTETVGASEGPFRQLNVALNASLALNYALSNRLSVSVGPSLRWQALSVFKTETGLRQTPTATGLQVGLRWKL